MNSSRFNDNLWKCPKFSKFTGPHTVEFSKMYKPLFIVFLDIVIAIVTLTLSVIIHLEEKVVDNDYAEPISIRQMLLIGYSFLKFFLNLAWVTFRFGPEHMNRSKVTNSLFWFRVALDSLFFFAVTFGEKIIEGHKDLDVNYLFYVILVSKVVMEWTVYKLSVKPAQKRATYQMYSKWSKGRKNYSHKHRENTFKTYRDTVK